MLFDSVVQALSTSQTPREAQEISTLQMDFSAIRGARVLLVEDNELNREVAMGLLEDAHLNIEQAENGAVAVQMITKQPYDLVLMDMQMPIMDGITATKAIRSNPRFASLPIIAMTANAMDRERDACLAAATASCSTRTEWWKQQIQRRNSLAQIASCALWKATSDWEQTDLLTASSGIVALVRANHRTRAAGRHHTSGCRFQR